MKIRYFVDTDTLYIEFRDRGIVDTSAIERPTPGHLAWPELDVDLTPESIDRPEHFPLVSRG